MYDYKNTYIQPKKKLIIKTHTITNPAFLKKTNKQASSEKAQAQLSSAELPRVMTFL